MGELKRVLLADDHRIVLDGLRSLLAGEFDLCDTARDGHQLMERAIAVQPDVIVADISMPLLNGIDAVKQLREAGVEAKVVFLTMHPDVTYLSRAMEAGASGYVLKHAAAEDLVEAIHLALRGQRFISPQLRTAAVAEFLDTTKRQGKETIDLTQRQREVLQLLAEGKSAKEIGGLLGISSRTVETHKYTMMDQLGVKTTAGLVQHAMRMGLVTGP
ncbi:MAG: response regulator transcription factor [Bryobacter sp.]|jgi:DNA-binding NarL/FixJ family response regulator|nr:response regulator transcription factor [Bryobacter sp. CoA8 C33]